MPARRVFLLSPARCDGERAKLVMNPTADFELAEQIRAPEGVELGEVFSFLSGLYFRGKLTYSSTFAGDAPNEPASFVITTDRGLVPPSTRVRRDDLLAFARVDIAGGDERFRGPLRRDCAALDATLGRRADVILLGSIATGKYADTLLETFGERLLFPREFVGRGDMSRGGLLLRCASERRELEYIPVLGATRHGKRPPKLERLR